MILPHIFPATSRVLTPGCATLSQSRMKISDVTPFQETGPPGLTWYLPLLRVQVIFNLFPVPIILISSQSPTPLHVQNAVQIFSLPLSLP